MASLSLVSCGGHVDYTLTSLDEGWQFCRVGTDQWYPAVVPGVVHTDLYRNKLIDNPYYSVNESSLQWIENEQWDYRTTFVPTQEQLSAGSLSLCFEGLDTYAHVYLNDSLILKADNMFVTWRVPVKGIVKEGVNRLRVRFLSTYQIGCQLSKKYPKLPADNDKGECTASVFTRKAQYHFGWDWGPRFVTAGIWKPVYLESYSYAAIDNVHYIELSQSPQKAEFVAAVTVEAIDDCHGEVTVKCGKGRSSVKSDFKKGVNRVEVPFVIENPEYWWPAGMGKGLPKLYQVDAILEVDGHTASVDSRKIGVRTVELVRQRDSVGESFLFEVNGEPLFMKGANVIPKDMFLPEVTPERYRRMAEIAAESNMNMLRVWGGGIYESDDFYNACDSLGILVWQDFPFACAFYPWDDDFYDSVRREARDNVRRLRNHPSLAIWCGNNEVDEAWHRWGYKENKKRFPWTDEQTRAIRKGIDDLFFDEVIPGVLAQEDTTRAYHPSSPLYGWGDRRSQFEGDTHYWGVFHGEEPFTAYKEKPGRFSNEYGHESLANYTTWLKWLSPDDMVYDYTAMNLKVPAGVEVRKPENDPFAVHQKNAKGYRVIRDYMAREVPVVDSLPVYVYLSQLVQADGIRVAMEGHRRNRPFTMGSIYWQMNDCWPVTSWSSMDYPFGYKALQYFARRSFAPTILSFDRKDRSRRVELWGVTDELKQKTGYYDLTLMTLGGDTIKSERFDLTIAPNSSVRLFDASFDELLGGADAADVILVADGVIDGVEMRDVLCFLPYKEMNFPKADIKIVAEEKCADGRRVTLKAANFVKALFVETDLQQSDNASDAYFDMLPGQQKTVLLHFDDNDAAVEYRLTNLNDIVVNHGKKL